MSRETGRPESEPALTVRDAPVVVTPGTTRDGAFTAPPSTTRDGVGPHRPTTGGTGRQPPATTRDGVGPQIRLDVPEPDGAAFPRVNLPPPLASQLTWVRDLPATGGEADLLICRNNADGRLVVVKLYRQSQPNLDQDTLGRIGRADAAHVVVVHDHGYYRGHGWEVQEYLEPGSLQDLLHQEGPALAVPVLEEVLAELLPALEHLHDLGIVHRDIKPSNILIRTRHPLDLVLADFGLAVVLAASREMRSGSRTSAYAAPEAAWGDTSASRDWWSLGITLLELGTGQHPFRGAEGRWMEDAQINTLLATKPIDVSLMDDPRWRHLLSGLLIRDPAHRWGREEVNRWRRGELPPLDDEQPAPAQVTVDRPGYVFRGEEHHDAESLSAHFSSEWNATAELILGRGLEELALWLEEVAPSEALTRALRACRSRRLPVDRLVAGLIVAIGPELEPTFRGFSVLPGRLPALARDALAGPARSRDAVEALRSSGSLVVYATIADCREYAQLDERWQLLSGETERLCVDGGLPREVVDSVRLLAGPGLLHVLADPSARAELEQRAATARRRPPEGAAWFRALATRTTPADLGLARDLVVVASRPVADDQQREQDDRERLERERRDREERDRRQAQRQVEVARRREERNRLAGPRLRRDRMFVGCAIFLLLTCAAPWYLGKVWIEHRIVVGLPWWDASQPVLPAQPWIVALNAGYDFMIRYVFGGAVVLGLLGAALLMPPWRGRRPARIVVAAVLFAALPMAPQAAAFVSDQFAQAAATSYTEGPIPTGRIAQTVCGQVWTSQSPVGTSYHRYALAGAPGTSTCTMLVGYSGWRQYLRVNAAKNGSFTSLASYPGMLVARMDISGSPNQLLGVNATTGKVAWHYACPDRKAAYLDGEVYHGVNDSGPYAKDVPYIQVTCAKGVVKVNPQTGKPLG